MIISGNPIEKRKYQTSIYLNTFFLEKIWV